MKKQIRLLLPFLVFTLFLQVFLFSSNTKVYATAQLRVQMYNTNTSSNTISPNFRIFNDGTTSQDMSNVKLRYYFTKDNTGEQHFACDNCMNSNVTVDGVTGSFVDMTSPVISADNYVEISFPNDVILNPNENMTLQTRIYNQNWLNYNQTNDYSYNASNTTYADWSNVTAYTSGSLSYGIEPTPPTPAAKKFLVIVSSKIINYCSSEVDQYMDDITAEGWDPTLIKVNNEADGICDNVCESPADLKALISGYYAQGCEGFVLIGSAPSIPSALWHKNPSSIDIGPSDLYYADMDTWTDLPGSNGIPDGIYESYYDIQGGIEYDANNPATPGNAAFIPEMIFGRISAGKISLDANGNINYELEGSRVAKYLTKIHDSRQSTDGIMTYDSKAFVFVDDDFPDDKFVQVPFMQNLTDNVDCVANNASTNKDGFLQLLQGEYRMGMEQIHGLPNEFSPEYYPCGTETSLMDKSKVDINAINNITVKLNYFHINSCSSCNFNEPSIGAAVLFNNIDSYSSSSKNSFVYNVTGMIVPSNFQLDNDYINDLKSECIGSSFKNLMARHTNPCMFNAIYTLLGDPTLRYNFSTPENKCPIIDNDFNDVIAYVNKPFKINFKTTDPENDEVYLDVSGLPTGAYYDSSTRCLYWTPSSADVGSSYSITANAYNKDASGNAINNYNEKFTIYVSKMILSNVDIENPGFESLNTDGTLSNWQQYINSDALPTDSIIKHSGNNSAIITNPTSQYSYYQLTFPIEKNTTYLISGYIKTSNVQNEGAYLVVESNTTTEQPHKSTKITGDSDWTPVYLRYYSGSTTSIDLGCIFYGTGTAWFDDIKLERDYNLKFDVTSVLAGWHKTGNAAIIYDDTSTYDGLLSAKVYSDDPRYASLSNEIDVLPNTNYRVSVKIKTAEGSPLTGGAKGAHLKVESGTCSVTSSPVFDTDGSWQEAWVYLNTGNNSSMNIFYNFGDSNNLCSGNVWFDDVVIEKDDNLGFDIVDGTNSIPAWNVYDYNLINNTTCSAISIDTAVKYSGQGSAKISSSAPNYVSLSKEIDVVPNATYRVGVWIRTEDGGFTGGTKGATFDLQCGTNLVSSLPLFNTYGDWRLIYLDIYTGDSTKMNICCKAGDSNELCSGNVWFDNISVDKKW